MKDQGKERAENLPSPTFF